MAFLVKVTLGAVGVVLIVAGVMGPAGLLLIGLVLFTVGVGWDFIREQATK